LDKLGVGFIGSGFVAGFHAEAWKGVRDAEITAIYNVREESARALTAKIDNLGVGKPKVYTDLREMLSEGSVNAVWILNPNFARLGVVEVIAEEAAQGRTDLVGVCCEKPLARTADEAEKMVELVEKPASCTVTWRIRSSPQAWPGGRRRSGGTAPDTPADPISRGRPRSTEAPTRTGSGTRGSPGEGSCWT